MTKVFHSRVYGTMHKRARRRMGFAGYRREDVWRLMEAEELKIAAALAWRPKAWWRRLVGWLWRLPGRFVHWLRRGR